MIIVNLNGGLGNQMFQYALGRVLAQQNHDILKLDTRSFNIFNSVDTLRSYELDIFNLGASQATRSESMRLSDPSIIKTLMNNILKTNIPTYPTTYIRERSHNFHQSMLNLQGNIYLDGFWQSEKYFLAYRNLILQEFIFPRSKNQLNRRLLKSIQNSESISIHVRRGDYVTNQAANKFHGICDLDYYKNAVSHILKHSNNPTFYVFSDDIGWCKKNLKISSNVKYIGHNKGESSWEDMRLMSACKHNIIANSSFSWWGAWLNKNPNKIVIAPKKWFKDKSVNSSDLLPESWIKL